MTWANAYVGIPYCSGGRDRNGCDCWGLFHLISREQFARDIPSYAGAYADATEHAEIGRLINSGISDWKRVDIEEPGDGLLIRCVGAPHHVATVIDRLWMIHARHGISSEICRINDWRARIVGCYRLRAE